MPEYRSQEENGAIRREYLRDLRMSHPAFYSLVVAQAHRFDVVGDELVVRFSPDHATLLAQCLGKKAWVERGLYQLTGRKMSLVASIE